MKKVAKILKNNNNLKVLSKIKKNIKQTNSIKREVRLLFFISNNLVYKLKTSKLL